MFEVKWVDFLAKKKKALKGEYWAFESVVLCFCDGQPIGDYRDLQKWSNVRYHLDNYRPYSFYQMLAVDKYKDTLMQRNRKYVSMAITVGGEICGSLLFELYSDIVPKTCQNFIKLCTGELGFIPKNETEDYRMHYLNTIFFRLVPEGWIQGGDILYGSGNAGRSIYSEKFEDENFAIKHDGRGVLSMVNEGQHTNSSQFMITFQPAAWMDYRYVAFGQLIEGAQTLNAMEKVPTKNERPCQEIKISEIKVLDAEDIHSRIRLSTKEEKYNDTYI
ncbi:unnamed protein product [Mesocestoides corti]|uniref:Peptidyl-prolyl cis-trans isomerase n=2 Tax=Mesocestoides corti TaxID=53468 RepID=A0A0R3U204_MESCO|nr:unnamed protein product [Mesocestoides corti]